MPDFRKSTDLNEVIRSERTPSASVKNERSFCFTTLKVTFIDFSQKWPSKDGQKWPLRNKAIGDKSISGPNKPLKAQETLESYRM